ncbi:Chromatin assembly factor 1, subunit A [Mortierella sp. GBA30]|nr:Chromatin assembly factor 1, subunit A [Mortierella sp. GBA30]
MSRTLSGFFSKGDSTTCVTNDSKPDTKGQNLSDETETDKTESKDKTDKVDKADKAVAARPEKSTPRKRASKAKTKGSSEDQQTAMTSKIATPASVPGSEKPKASPRPKGTKKSTKAEVVSEVVIPKTPKRNSKTVATAMDISPLPNPKTTSPTATSNSTGSPFIVDHAAKETMPRSPSKSSLNGNLVSNLAASATSSGLSKLNKIDTASMFKVRNGKAYITETKLKFSAHPSAIADLYRFHEYREKLREAEDLSQYEGVSLEDDHVEITSIPEVHLGIVAKLVEESELLLQEMASNFTATLCPRGFEAFEDFAESVNAHEVDKEVMDMDMDTSSEDNKKALTRRSGTTISSTAIIEAIQAVARRVNYGIPVSNLPGPVSVTPANLSVYRWEVQDIDRFFPSDMKAAVIKRRCKRMGASAALTAWFLGLDAALQEELCPAPVTAVMVPGVLHGIETGSLATGGKRSRLSMGGETMDVDGEATQTTTAVITDADGTSRPGAILLQGQPTIEAAVDPAVIESKMREAEAKKKEAEAKEERRLEKERKIAERQLEKDMKEAERLQKEEAKKRKAEEERLKKEQTSLRFVGFFKTAAPPAVKKDGTQPCVKKDTSAPALLERFHPFHVKKNTTLAPINRFVMDYSNETIDAALGLNPGMESTRDGDVDMDVDSDHDVIISTLSRLDAKETLSLLLSRKSNAGEKDETQRAKRLPQNSKTMTVTEAMQSGLLLQDQDDDSDSILTWKDIPALRMRLLQFAENYRPAYFGTWSKRSKQITGRKFLGKDTDLIEYDFDSEAEWEEDEEGEECKSDEDDEDAEEMCSEQEEEDDWLVPEGYLSDDEGLDAGEEGGSKSDIKKSKEQRRPTLAHVTPIVVGPVFEVTLGECSSHAALEAYHIEFLGDYGIGMDMYHHGTESRPLAAPLTTEIQV